ncbi:MAG: hypothetical protein JSS95_04495 [Acidobacteria bacterium]|nr:hypothetical protein [Acidobacteriota bacterium]
MPGEELTPEEMDALVRKMEERALDERIVRELERVPEISATIPSDFAARVAAQVPARREITVTPTHYGRTAIWISFGVLFVALVALSTYSFVASTIGAAVETFLCVQFLAIAVWIGVRRWRAS